MLRQVYSGFRFLRPLHFCVVEFRIEAILLN